MPTKPASKTRTARAPRVLTVRLRIVVLAPPRPRPDETGFGLQEKRAGDWILHAGVRRPNGDLCFECECQVVAVDGEPRFAGRFVQSASSKPFLYLSWKPKAWTPGTPEPQAPPCVRRMKVNLSSITLAQVKQVARNGGSLQAVVHGTGKDGGPACASVPLLGGGWSLGRR